MLSTIFLHQQRFTATAAAELLINTAAVHSHSNSVLALVKKLNAANPARSPNKILLPNRHRTGWRPQIASILLQRYVALA